MVVCPSFGANITPELCFFGADYAHIDLTLRLSTRLLDAPIKDIAELDWPVVARAKQIQRINTCKRADFMKHWRAVVVEESLNHFEGCRVQFLEDPESEALSDRRIGAIEDGVGSSAFNPFGAAVGEQPPSCVRV